MDNTVNDNTTVGDITDKFILLANLVAPTDTIGLFFSESEEGVKQVGAYYENGDEHAYTQEFPLDIILVAFIVLEESWEKASKDINDGIDFIAYLQCVCEVAVEEMEMEIANAAN